MPKPALTSFDVSNAARVAHDFIASGRTPQALQDAAAQAGVGPHNKWAHKLIPVAVASLKEYADNPKTGRDAWLKEHVPLVAQVDGADRSDLARWLLDLGDPAWDAVDAVKSGTMAERVVAARAGLAGQVVAATFDAVVSAAQKASDHHAATVDQYEADDADLEKRFAAEKVAEDVQAEWRRQVAASRLAARQRAMWG